MPRNSQSQTLIPEWNFETETGTDSRRLFHVSSRVADTKGEERRGRRPCHSLILRSLPCQDLPLPKRVCSLPVAGEWVSFPSLLLSLGEEERVKGENQRV